MVPVLGEVPCRFRGVYCLRALDSSPCTTHGPYNFPSVFHWFFSVVLPFLFPGGAVRFLFVFFLPILSRAFVRFVRSKISPFFCPILSFRSCIPRYRSLFVPIVRASYICSPVSWAPRHPRTRPAAGGWDRFLSWVDSVGGGQFRVDPESVRSDADGIIAAVLPGDGGGSGGGNCNAPLSLLIRFYANGVCRVKLDEPPPAPRRWEVRRPNASFLLTSSDPSFFRFRFSYTHVFWAQTTWNQCGIVLAAVEGLS